MRSGLTVAGAVGLGLALLWVWLKPFALDQLHADHLLGLFPRAQDKAPVIVVEIDEAALKEYGQWPWPRTLIARLIDDIALGGPFAVGVDILFPEPDRTSPGLLARDLPDLPESTVDVLRGLKSNDAHLAEALALSPSVLAAVSAQPPLRSLPILTEAASGQGLINHLIADDGVARHVLAAERATSGDLVPSLSLALLALADRAPILETTDGLSIGGLSLPTRIDANDRHVVRLYPTEPNRDRHVSAAQILSGRIPADIFTDQLVLIGLTGIGLQDVHMDAAGHPINGVDIHAQFLAQILADDHPIRPGWSIASELIGVLIAVVILTVAARRVRPVPLLGVALGLSVLIYGLGPVLFASRLLLVDSLNPALAIWLPALLLSAATAGAALREKRSLQAEIQHREVETARLRGELEAARKIQLGLLPSAQTVAEGERRLDLAAYLEPALEVGGDLYDMFFIDKDRLFFMVGDVSGKGVPASLFMAISKALYKNAVLRGSEEIGAIMTQANREIARENPELLFITLFAGVLDLRSGLLSYCNAGHDNPLRISADGKVGGPVTGGDGPPLCVLDEYEYEGETLRLEPAEALLVTTDGITEAMDPAGRLYGTDRLHAHIRRHADGTKGQAFITGLIADVTRHADGAPASDDITVMFIRYLGQSID